MHSHYLLRFFQLTALEESEGTKEELDERMAAIDNQLVALRKTLNFLCKHTGKLYARIKVIKSKA